MILGRQILHLLYTNQVLNCAEEVAKQFVTAFKNKLASAVDDPDLLLECGIAAILDPRQKLLGKFRHIFEPVCGVKWLGMCGAYWGSHDNFVREVTN